MDVSFDVHERLRGSEEEVARLADDLRVLRDVCVDCSAVESALGDERRLADFVRSCLSAALTRAQSDGAADAGRLACRRALQFVGNLATRSDVAGRLVWRESLTLPTLWPTLLLCDDAKMREFASMALYNCLRSAESAHCCSAAIVEALLDSAVAYGENDWLDLAIDDILRRPLPSINCGAKSTGYFYERAAKVLDLASRDSLPVDAENVAAFSKLFVSAPNLDSLPEDALDCHDSLSHLIAEASEYRSYEAIIAQAGVVQKAIDLLRQVVGWRQRADASTTDAKANGRGLKTSCLRIVGNVCCDDAAKQRLARSLGALPAVLACTAVDWREPFAQQWAVWAVRALCNDCADA